MYKYNFNQVYNNKNSKTTRQQKRTAKKEFQEAIKAKNNIEIKLKHNQYRISHKKIRRKLLPIMKLKQLKKS